MYMRMHIYLYSGRLQRRFRKEREEGTHGQENLGEVQRRRRVGDDPAASHRTRKGPASRPEAFLTQE